MLSCHKDGENTIENGEFAGKTLTEVVKLNPDFLGENGKKFETLVVDLIKPMESVLPFEVVREKEFAPIKNKTGVDSVESARELLKQNGVEL